MHRIGIGMADAGEPIALPDLLEHAQKQIAPLWACQPGLAMITAASDEMQFVGAVVAPGMVGHQTSLLAVAEKSCDIRPCRSHLYKKRKGGPAPRNRGCPILALFARVGGDVLE